MSIRIFIAACATILLAACSGGGDRPTIAMVFEAKEANGAEEFRRGVAAAKGAADVQIFTAEGSSRSLTSGSDLEGYDIVFIDGSTEGLSLTASEIAKLAAGTKLLVVNPDGTLRGNVDLARHPDIPVYWANRSVENDAALVQYLAEKVGGARAGNPIAKPVVYPDQGFYHPAAGRLYPTLQQYLAWYGTRKDGVRYDPSKPAVGLSSYLVYYRHKNLAALDGLIAEAERQGGVAVTLLRNGAADFTPFMKDGKPVIDVLLNDSERLNVQDRDAGIDQVRKLGVPVLQSVPYAKGTIADFRASPGGLAPEMTSRVVDSEREGQFEPIAIAARDPSSKTRIYEPMTDQIRWRVQRAMSWAKLHRAKNADKRIVFTFWSEAGGKSDVGGDPDDFLDVPGSLEKMLRQMRAAGYSLGDSPLPTSVQLADRMARQASNVGNWSQGELAKRAADGSAALIPVARYLEWYGRLPPIRRQEIEAAWGPPPGKTMVATAPDGQRVIVIPRIEVGNVLIAPHPMWGYLEDEKVLMSKDALPPHHQYLAFFLWLQNEWKADAWVSMFSNIVLQPGKNEGPLADDHIGIMLGGLPHIHPERLGASGSLSNKRKGLALTPGWYNIVTPSDASEAVGELRGLLERYEGAPDVQKAGFDAAIRREVKASGLSRGLKMDVETIELGTLVVAADAYIAELDANNMPWGGKILGDAPQGAAMPAMVAGMLGNDLDAALEEKTTEVRAMARKLVVAVIEDGRTPAQAVRSVLKTTAPDVESVLAKAPAYAEALRSAPRETEAILAALEGDWIEPGPMGEPFRKPDVLPPGRVLFNFDVRRTPTPEAEDIGAKQAEALIRAFRDEHAGAYPDKLAIVLFSADIAKTNGVSEAQALRLLGARIKRNWRGEVVGVELIPREELGRPRVDVLITTSGTYRDHYQSKVDLITEAARLAGASPEADNPVAKAVTDAVARLKAGGASDNDARLLAAVRVFSPAPGAYSPSIQFLARSGEQRGDEAKMAELFTRRMGHAYGGGLYGQRSDTAFRIALTAMDAAVLPRTSDVNGMLDQPMSAGFLGGLNLAKKDMTGEETPLFVSSLADLTKPEMRTAAQAIQTELRTRYFNPKWLKENQAHGYDGARNFMFLTDHLDLWDTTATETVSSEDWAEVKRVFVDDSLDLGMDAFFDKSNPFAHQMLMTNLLGAAQRGHWKATPEELAQVSKRLVQSVADHGPACEANQCRNPSMTEFIGKALASLPDAAPLLASYTAGLAAAASPAGAPGAPPTVTGKAVEEVQAPPSPPASETSVVLALVIGAGLLLLALGWFLGGDRRRTSVAA